MTLAVLGSLGDALHSSSMSARAPAARRSAAASCCRCCGAPADHPGLGRIAPPSRCPSGCGSGHSGAASSCVVTVANAGRAVPSIGVVFLFFAALGAGFFNLMFALVLLAIPPILPTPTSASARSIPTWSTPPAGWASPERSPARGRAAAGAAARLRRDQDLDRQRHRHRDPRPAGRRGTLGDPIINAIVYGDAGRLGAAILVAALAIAAEVGLSAVQRKLAPEGLRLSERAASRRRLLSISKRRITPTS